MQRSGNPVSLGSLGLEENYLKTNKTVTFNATMTASTATINGASVTVVTVRLGTLASGGGIRTVSLAAAMVWTPSPTATDLFGNPCSAAPVSETGTLDRDF